MELQCRKSAEFRFRPDIGSAEEVLLQSGRNAGESRQELIERLACTDKERLEAVRRQKAEQHYAQFDFRPALNPISRLVGRQPSVELLHKVSARDAAALVQWAASTRRIFGPKLELEIQPKVELDIEPELELEIKPKLVGLKPGSEGRVSSPFHSYFQSSF